MKRKRKCLQITSGLFEGALLTTDKKTGKFYVLNYPLDSHNVKSFQIIKSYPMFYYGMFAGYLAQIVWKNNKVSYFIADEGIIHRVAKSIMSK